MAKQQRNRTVYKTERIEVIRHDFRDFSLFVDGEYISSFGEQYEAEHEGAMQLEEEARDIAAGLIGQMGVLV